MGAGAQSCRRALVQQVGACIALANECNQGLLKAQVAHNTLVDLVRDDIAVLTKRADAARAWCQENERLLKEIRTHGTLIEARFECFRRMSFRQRLGWFFWSLFPDVPPQAVAAVDAHTRVVEPAPTRLPVGMGIATRPLP